MRNLTQRAEQLFNQGTIKVAELVRLEFSTGTYGFCSASSEIEYGGLTYVPGGIIDISAINGQWSMNSQGLTLTLAARADDGLTPDVLATVQDEGWHQRPVIIKEAIYDPETYELLLVETIYRGRIDTLNFQDGSDCKLVANCESLAMDNNREGYRMRSNNDQHLINAGDNFFSFAETEARTVVQWGQNRKA